MLNKDSKSAILAIVIVLPITGYSLWILDQNKSTIQITERHKVLVTFYPLYEFTKAVGGSKVDVSLIIPIWG